ncbi:MAG: PqqD family protein [Pseudomonadota bacterium]
MTQKRYAVPDHVIVKKVGEDTVILDLQSGIYFGLDPVGTRMIELIQSGLPLTDVRATILDEYDVPETVLSDDLTDFVDTLLAKNLVEPV